MTRLYKKQQENPHVCPNERLIRRSRKWEERRWSMRLSYSNGEAASGNEKHMKDSSGNCSHLAAEVIRPWWIDLLVASTNMANF